MGKSIKVNEGTLEFLNGLFAIMAPVRNSIKPGCFSCQMIPPGARNPFSEKQALDLMQLFNEYKVTADALTADWVLRGCYKVWPIILDGCAYDLGEDEEIASIDFKNGAITFKFVTHREIDVLPS